MPDLWKICPFRLLLMTAGTPALALLAQTGTSHVVREYDHDPATTAFGLEAAEKLDVEPERVFKTLIAELDGHHVVAIVPVTHQVNLKSLAKAASGKHAVMANPNDAMRITGYVVGGISPLGQKKKLITVIDETAQLWDTILVSAGKRGLDVELDPNDLIALTSAIVADIAV